MASTSEMDIADQLRLRKAQRLAMETGLVSKRKTVAPVWVHFGFQADAKVQLQDPDHLKCRMCDVVVGAKDGNTSNLYSHLKTRHPEVYIQIEKRPTTSKSVRPPGQPSLSESWQKTQKLPSTSREHKELTRAVTYCLAKDMLAISTVDKTWI